jgi:hypothetical protein
MGSACCRKKAVSIVLMQDKSDGEDLHDDIKNYRDGSHAGVERHRIYAGAFRNCWIPLLGRLNVPTHVSN